jgi:uncharacterized damage-inducible protein DinB
MDVIARLNREFAWNAWANAAALRSLQAVAEPPPRAVEVMGHLVGSEWLWLRRLGRPVRDLSVWPLLSLAECENNLPDLARTWQRFLDALAPSELDRAVSYTNTRGEPWTNTVADILTHVVLHASYHRGQIATLLGRAGHPAAYTDYIECVRRGNLDGGQEPELE